MFRCYLMLQGGGAWYLRPQPFLKSSHITTCFAKTTIFNYKFWGKPFWMEIRKLNFMVNKSFSFYLCWKKFIADQYTSIRKSMMYNHLTKVSKSTPCLIYTTLHAISYTVAPCTHLNDYLPHIPTFNPWLSTCYMDLQLPGTQLSQKWDLWLCDLLESVVFNKRN